MRIVKLGTSLEYRRLLLGTPLARLRLANFGYDPVYGARPLRRLMQKEIDDKLANLILAGAVADGTLLKADVSEDKSTIEIRVD